MENCGFLNSYRNIPPSLLREGRDGYEKPEIWEGLKTGLIVAGLNHAAHLGVEAYKLSKAIDVDVFFDAVVDRTIYLGEQDSKIVDPFVKMEVFYSKVKTGGVIDLKNNADFKAALREYTKTTGRGGKHYASVYKYKGKIFELQDFGNYNFGVYSKAIGYSLNFVKNGAGIYQIWSGTSSWRYITSRFDDPRDARFISAGYNR